jgi:hypothetical protein
MTALSVVPDIPEEELVRLLKPVVKDERAQQTLEKTATKVKKAQHKQTTTSAAMQVDGTTIIKDIGEANEVPPTSAETSSSSRSTNPPRLSKFLAAFLAYPTSPAAIRVALRHHLSDVTELLPVICILERWTEVYVNMGWENASKKIKSKSSSKKVFGEPPEGGFHVAKLRPHQEDWLPPFESVSSLPLTVLTIWRR